MGTIAAEVVALEQKRDTRGRRITPRERRIELVAAYRASGLTQKEFARREGISEASLAKWSSPSGGVDRAAVVRFAETKIEAGALAARWAFEITLPNGYLVRAASAAGLAELLAIIRS